MFARGHGAEESVRKPFAACPISMVRPSSVSRQAPPPEQFGFLRHIDHVEHPRIVGHATSSIAGRAGHRAWPCMPSCVALTSRTAPLIVATGSSNAVIEEGNSNASATRFAFAG
jgi:hypothetical protein